MSSVSDGQYTVPGVVEEARGLLAAASIGMSLDLGYLRIWEPSEKALSRAESRLSEIGGELSETDVQVVALALDLRERGMSPVILSDDYGLQNLAKVMGLEYSSVATPGIKAVYRWRMRCPGCKREYPGGVRTCSVCGTKLERFVERESL